MAHEGNLHIRVPEGAKRRWLEAAAREGLSLSAWVLRAADRELARVEVAKAVAEETAPVVPATQRVTYDGTPVERRAQVDDEEIDLTAVIEGTAAFPSGAEYDAGFPADRDPPAVVAPWNPLVKKTPEELGRLQQNWIAINTITNRR